MATYGYIRAIGMLQPITVKSITCNKEYNKVPRISANLKRLGVARNIEVVLAATRISTNEQLHTKHCQEWH